MKLQEIINILYKSKRGIKTFRGKVFYPTRTKTCKDCELIRYNTTFALPDGCYYFDTKKHLNKQQPAELCIPVKDKTYYAEMRGNDVSSWIEKELKE